MDNQISDVVKNQKQTQESFSFTGSGKEYFGIWLVNIFLTILTLGIYSSWAKVRRKRYFYGNSWLAGHNFEYHARPMQIFRGRMIVVAGLTAYQGVLNFVGMFFPLTSLIFPVLLISAIPWIIQRGLRFTMRVTSYRNVHFDFHGSYWGALSAFLLGPILAVLSCGILVPVFSRWIWRYMITNTSYGGCRIICEAKLKALYRQWWGPAIFVVISIVGLISIVSSLYWQQILVMKEFDELLVIGTVFFLIWVWVVYAIAVLFYQAGVRNVVLNATLLDDRHQLVSTIAPRRYGWIAISNFLATVFSAGLLRPWAAVRMAHYLAVSTGLMVSGSLDDYLDQVRETNSAFGAEYMDSEGFDFGF